MQDSINADHIPDGRNMVRKEQAASSDFPLKSNAALAVTAPALHFPASVGEDGVRLRCANTG